MRKLFGLLVAVSFILVAGVSFSQDAAAPVAPAAVEELAPVVADTPVEAQYTGVIEVTPADAANNETAATIILDMGEQAYKLVAGDAAKLAELEAANGKTVTVTGTVVAAGEDHLMDTLQVASWSEAAATETPAATEEPAATEAPAATEETAVDAE